MATYLITLELTKGMDYMPLHNTLVSWHAQKLTSTTWLLESAVVELAQPLLDELRKWVKDGDRILVSQSQLVVGWNTVGRLPVN
ncbi:hypothetical protein [Gallaecimonas pentaromativorans]|uniref:Uncharacterized protein n=1 Tax=Gallaecimonas pentaromativorans TaxID=584787 RepID=A0A3N1P321_9GAMM|nr:hypothetical protein [Gallaecimonas pentaromativorans]MED5524045.1 hypothetical protein [Pseudomonadota bacterium]ROQ22469.1 hypothetical protein EDC28_110112 [Gallaecimonas pentaromativorans]